MTPYYCPDSYVNVVLPIDEWAKDETGDWLIIGHPGVDGIEFRVKSDRLSDVVFAYYPIEGVLVKIAESSDDLIAKWKANAIVL